MLVGHTYPVFAADLALTSIKKVGHHCAIGKSLLVLRKGFDFNKTDAAIADGMVVSIAMSLLNDDFVFESVHVSRYVEDGGIVSRGDASCGSNHQSRGRSRGDQRSFTTQLFRQVGAGSLV